MNDSVRIVEVGPRDGLQNEKTKVSTETKIELINRLSDTGLSMVEATSFVSPKAIPQLEDAQAVFTGINKYPGVAYPVLVPNLQGLERAMSAGAQHVAVFAAASETFSQKNIGVGIDESLTRYQEVVSQAKKAGLWVRGYLSCVAGCPYEGAIKTHAVTSTAQRLMGMGIDEMSIDDTIGVGTPKQIKALLRALNDTMALDKLAVHFHDTYGQALANLDAASDQGIRIADASVAGLGGCPYAKGATGNVATEDVVYMLNGLGIKTGINLEKLAETGSWICDQIGKSSASKVNLALAAR